MSVREELCRGGKELSKAIAMAIAERRKKKAYADADAERRKWGRNFERGGGGGQFCKYRILQVYF